MPVVTDLTARRLEGLVAREQRSGRLPSVVAALTRDGSLVWRGSRGTASGSPDSSAVDLQYRIGSITKTMTAVLVMQLRDAGRLRLNDPVSAYLPEVDWQDVTVRSLLSHSSGLPAEPAGEWWERVVGGPFADLVDRGVAARPFEPGTTFHYSNVAYAMLGEVAARLQGRPWWECLSELVLQPLGMARTTYDPFDPHARGYSVAPYSPLISEEPATDTGAMAPAGQVWSTVLDLATYADFLITGHPDVLAAETLNEMGTPQSGTSRDGLATGHGLGLRLLGGGSGTLVGHTGSMPGFLAGLFVDRPRRTGAVVVANATTGLGADRLPRTLLEELDSWEPDVADEWAPVDSVPEEVLELLGVWHWGNTARLLSWDGSRLQMQPLTGERQDSFRLGPDGLVGSGGYHHGERLEVERRPDGSVSHLVCSTFVLTRVPYDPSAPIPGGPPATRR